MPEALLELVARNPRAAERKQVGQLLVLWDTRLVAAVAGGGLRHFSSLSQAERERVLLSWADSRVPQRRAAFQALRKGTLLAYYGRVGGNPCSRRWAIRARSGRPRTRRRRGSSRSRRALTLKTWLQDAHEHGTRILVRTRADRVMVENGAARGVEARTADGHRVTVRARAVGSAAGALNTPDLLARSACNRRRWASTCACVR